jgi:hypothetical protein
MSDEVTFTFRVKSGTPGQSVEDAGVADFSEWLDHKLGEAEDWDLTITKPQYGPSASSLTVEQQVTFLRGMMDEEFMGDVSAEDVDSGRFGSRVRELLESAPPFIGYDAKGEVYSQTGVASPDELEAYRKMEISGG